MDDILKSIKAYLYDRSSSPLFGAFVLSWSAWNYKFIVTLFSSEPPMTKFEIVGQVFSHVDIELLRWLPGTLLNGFLVPAAMAYAYIYWYPFLAKPVYEYSLKKQKELRELKQATEDNRLLSVEESRELHRRLATLQSNFDEETTRYERELSNLRKVIAESESRETEKNAKSKPINLAALGSKELGENEEAILKEFAGRSDDENVSDRMVHANVGGQIDVVRVYLDDLASEGFIRHAGTHTQSKAKLYTLQPKGRKYLVANGLVGESTDA